MLPPIKAPPPRSGPAVVEDENETIVLNRRAFPKEGEPSGSVDDPSEDDTTKLVMDASEDAVTGDEFTRLMPKNLGDISLATGSPSTRRLPDRSSRRMVDEEHTNCRPFQGGAGGQGAAHSQPEIEELHEPSPSIPLRPPAAGMPAQTKKSVLTAFAPLTPERIQAQLDAAREARRMNRPPEAEGVFMAPPDWGRGRVLESDPAPMSRSTHAPAPRGSREKSTQPTVSWAFALAAMAVIGSVATVAIVEGSGDDLLRTGASFVDPSMARGSLPSPEAPKAATPSTQSISVMDLPPAQPVQPAPMVPVVPVVPTTMLGVATATPPPEPVKTEAPKHATAPAKAPAARPAAAPKGNAPKKPPIDDDLANAAAADALARAQLQQSL